MYYLLSLSLSPSLCPSVLSPLDSHKEALVSLVVLLVTVSVDQGLVLTGLDICQELLTVSSYLNDEVRVFF